MTHGTRPPSTRAARIGVLVLVMATAACGSSGGGNGGSAGNAGSGSSVTLKIGYIADVHGAGLVTAADQNGFWAKAGVNAQTTKFTSGPNEIEAMAAGKLDIAYIGPGALWTAMAGKATVIAVDSLSNADALVADPSKVPDLKALAGKKIGYPTGTSSQMILDLALQRAGLTSKDVDLIPMDQNLIPTAYLSGQIDVAAPFPAGVSQILAQSKSSKVIVSDQDFQPQYVFPEVWVASPALVKQDPQAVVDFLKAFNMANDWRDGHISEAVALSAKDAGTPATGQQYLAARTTWLTSAQLLADNQSGQAGKWFSALNGLFVQTGQVASTVPTQNYDDTALFQQAYNAVSGQS
jgi:NitT/TauT family transport system substrate-binding protein